MRVILSLVLALMIATPVSAIVSLDQGQRLIVPGQRIGPARLGMNPGAIDQVSRDTPCPVLATYDALGRAVWLETHWGGACLISDEIQVGLPFEPALRAFGKPERITEDVRYLHATAFWVIYQDRGIGFRVLGWPSGTIIQTIAVFPGAASYINDEVGRTTGSSMQTRQSPQHLSGPSAAF